MYFLINNWLHLQLLMGTFQFKRLYPLLTYFCEMYMFLIFFIFFPILDSPRSQDLIVISGYERNVEEARQAIQQLVAELQDMVSHDVHLDPRTHARIIGARGKAIRKLMEEFKVRFVSFCVCVHSLIFTLNTGEKSSHSVLYRILFDFHLLFVCSGGYPVPSAGLRRARQSDGDGPS